MDTVSAHSLQTLPADAFGLSLVIVGVVLLALELITSHGLMMLAGLIAFTVGAFLLVGSGQALHVSGVVALAAGGVMIVLLVLAFRKAWKARNAKPVTGVETLAGSVGTVERPLSPVGLVALSGELWSARASEPVPAGARVRVVRVEGNILVVEKTA